MFFIGMTSLRRISFFCFDPIWAPEVTMNSENIIKWPGNSIIPLDKPFVDERGEIRILLNKDIKSAVLITSKKGAVRANHYHTSDWHYCYVLSGSIEYYSRPTGSDEEPKKVLVKTREMFLTPPMVDHAMVFPEDTVFLALSGSTRDHDSYESEVVRIELVKP